MLAAAHRRRWRRPRRGAHVSAPGAGALCVARPARRRVVVPEDASPMSSTRPRRGAATIRRRAPVATRSSTLTAAGSCASARTFPATRTSDVISGLLGAERDGHVVTDEDIVQVVRLLIVAGHNSTTGAIGNAILRLADGAWCSGAVSASSRSSCPRPIEEFLRLEASVQAMPRWASEDTEIHGRPHRQGRDGDAAVGIGEPRSRALRQTGHVRSRSRSERPSDVRARHPQAASEWISRGSSYG